MLRQRAQTQYEAATAALGTINEAVEKKGADARLHVGLIAQEILEAFEAEGLDATKYGLVCHDSWDDQYEYETVTDQEAVLDEKGNVVTPERRIR